MSTLVPCDMYSLCFASLSVFVNNNSGLCFLCFFKFMRGNFCDSFLSLEILLGIFLLRSWAKGGVMSLYMGVCSLVDRNLRGLDVVSLNTQRSMSCSLPRMQLQQPLTSPRVMLMMGL